jgi:hypothetical protein
MHPLRRNLDNSARDDLRLDSPSGNFGQELMQFPYPNKGFPPNQEKTLSTLGIQQTQHAVHQFVTPIL